MNIDMTIKALYELRETYDRNNEEYEAIDRAISALEDYECTTASEEEEI